MSASTPLLRPKFNCPACSRPLQNAIVPVPAFLRCPYCKHTFVANTKTAKRRYIIILIVGLLVLFAGVGLTVSSFLIAEKMGGGVYFVYYGSMASGLLLVLRGIYGLCKLQNRRNVAVISTAQTLAQPFLACQDGDVAGLRVLLDQGANVNSINPSNQWSCLHYASNKGHTEMVDLLLARGASPNIGANSTPFLEAACSGHVAILGKLAGAGANDHALVTSRDARGNVIHSSALTLACIRGHVAVVEYLLQRGHAVNQQLLGSNPPLLCAAKGGFISIIQLLIRSGANPNIQNSLRLTALHVAVANNHPDAVRVLLEMGADPSIPEEKGLTPRLYAERTNRVNLVRIFDEWAASAGHASPPPYSLNDPTRSGDKSPLLPQDVSL